MEWAAPGEPTPQDLLNPLAVAMTSLEALDHFGGDEALKTEMEAMVREARAEVVAILNALLECLTSTSDPYPQADPGKWRRALISLARDTAATDFARCGLNAPQRQPYRFDLIPQHVLTDMPCWGHRQVIAMFTAAVRKAVQCEENWHDTTVFAIAVRDHAQAFVLAWFIACEPSNA